MGGGEERCGSSGWVGEEKRRKLTVGTIEGMGARAF